MKAKGNLRVKARTETEVQHQVGGRFWQHRVEMTIMEAPFINQAMGIFLTIEEARELAKLLLDAANKTEKHGKQFPKKEG